MAKKKQYVISKNGKKQHKKKMVPGWGGSIGRVAKTIRGYTSKGGIAYRALTLAKKVADAVNIEYKNYHFGSAATSMDFTSSNLIDLTGGVTPGTSDSQRIGDSFKVQNVTMRYFVKRNGADAYARVIIIWDPQNKTNTLADLLQQDGNVYAPISPKQYDKRFQSRILYDEAFPVTSQYSLVGKEISLAINEHTQFEAGTQTINTGSLKMFFLSDLNANEPLITYYGRFTFTDN